ncbi:MAG: tetratricopeptide repeat protein [Anaerolineales bacterium]|nr:tetratricopeptide repeat protein [Anaerolineales bacterium]
MESPGAYIPPDRRRAIAEGQALPDRMQGTALFADISGFTLLTDALLQAFGSRRGTDELTRRLNQVYDALIREVDRYGGSVINFSGDAITCWFSDGAASSSLILHPSSLLHPSSFRAVACGLAMQQAMRQFAALEISPRQKVALSLKIGAAGGTVRRFLVGDPHIQYLDVLAGATVERMALAQQIARRGEVVLSAELAAQVGGQARLVEGRSQDKKTKYGSGSPASFGVVAGLIQPIETYAWPEAFAPAEDTGLAETHMRPWLLPPVYHRLRNGQDEFLAEIRPAVALFLKFGGLDYDHDESAGVKLDEFIRWAQNVLVRYDSYVMQLLNGDKGSHLYAIFGAPSAHDDDPERAVAAALELQAAIQQFDFISQIQMGLNQGRMRVGAYGSATRRTYGVLGDGVNIAARLMSRARSGQILVSQSIVEAAASSYYFKHLGPLKFKGKQEPITVSLALSPRLPSAQKLFTTFKEPLVGRSEQLRQLERILAEMLAGQNQMVWLEGVTGIGKSHLVAEFAEQALQQGVRVIVGACQGINQTTTYYPWRQIFRSLLGLPDERAVHLSQEERLARQVAQLEAIIAEMNPAWLIRLPLLGDLLGLLILDNPTTAAFEPQLRQDALFDLADELLQTWAQDQPLLVLIEDAQWLDEASRALLLALGRVRAKGPILFILVQTLPPVQVEQEPWWLELNRLPQVHRLKLGELSPPEVAQMVAQRLQGEVSPLALELIQAQAQGNPLFTKELVNALQEREDLCRREDGLWWLSEAMFNALQQANCLIKQQGQWTLVEHASLAAARLDVPDSIHSIVLARLDRLPEPLKVTLKVASVIGRLFEFDLLVQAHPAQSGEAGLLEQIDLLQALDFIQPGGVLLQQRLFLFKHSITHEVTYATLLEQQERSLHGAVAEALERWQPEAVERLAYHFSRSEAQDKMLFYLDLAAGKAQHEYANETALAYYTHALTLTERWRWRKGQVEILHVLGRRQEEEVTLQTFASNLDAPTFEVGYLWGQYYEATGNYAKAQAAIELALADSRDKRDLGGEARCLAYLGLIARRQGNYEQAKTWYHQALALFEAKHTTTEPEAWVLTQVLNGLGTVFRQQGHFDLARQCHEQGLALSRQTGNRSGEAQAYNDLGVVSLYQRRLAEALAYHRQALEIWEAIGDRVGEGRSGNNLAQISRDLGDYEQAQGYLNVALNIFQAIGNRWEEVNVWNDLGILYQELGNLAKAETCLQQGLTLAQEIGDEAGQAYILVNLALVVRDKGELEAAEVLLKSGLALAQAQNDQYLMSGFLNYLSAINLQQGKLESAITQAKLSLALRQELDMRFATPDNLAILASAYLSAGDLTQALKYATQTKAILAECGAEGPEFSQQDYFIIHQVFTATGQTEHAQATLELAYQLVLARAKKITDQTLRQSFLEQVAINRTIITTYEDFVTRNVSKQVSHEPVVRPFLALRTFGSVHDLLARFGNYQSPHWPVLR